MGVSGQFVLKNHAWKVSKIQIFELYYVYIYIFFPKMSLYPQIVYYRCTLKAFR